MKRDKNIDQRANQDLTMKVGISNIVTKSGIYITLDTSNNRNSIACIMIFRCYKRIQDTLKKQDNSKDEEKKLSTQIKFIK